MYMMYLCTCVCVCVCDSIYFICILGPSRRRLPRSIPQRLYAVFACFTGFTGTKVQILTQTAHAAEHTLERVAPPFFF